MVVITLLRFIAFYLQLAETLDNTNYLCRYQYHYTAMSWASARAVCESTNRTLLKIDSSGEMTNITNVIMPRVEKVKRDLVTISNTLWIGLHRELDSVRLLWDDCEEYTVIPGDWSDSSGGLEGCVVFNITDNKYSIRNCSETQSFICEDITEDIADCYIKLSALSPDVPSQIGNDGSADGSNTLESCSELCYGDLACAAFQLKTNDCYRHRYYEPSIDLFSTRNMFVYIKNIFIINDTHPANSPEMSNYYCPEQTTPIQPTSSSVSIVSSSEATTTLIYSTDSTVAVLSSSESVTTTLTAVSSSNGVITSTYVISGTTTSDCYCSCTLTLSSSAITNAELQAKIEQIKTELTVDKKETSSYKRKLTSAPDNRVSAQSIGYVGIVILTIVGGLLVCIDIPTLAKDTKSFFQRICSPCKRQ